MLQYISHTLHIPSYNIYIIHYRSHYIYIYDYIYMYTCLHNCVIWLFSTEPIPGMHIPSVRMRPTMSAPLIPAISAWTRREECIVTLSMREKRDSQTERDTFAACAYINIYIILYIYMRQLYTYTYKSTGVVWFTYVNIAACRWSEGGSRDDRWFLAWAFSFP
jgi:hypothetical protein